jgi:hypothetical protein
MGIAREKFNENLCAWRSQNLISKWPQKVKLAIASWYGGCRQQLVNDNPEVFGGTGEPAKYGLIEVMMNIAKEGTHGDFESVESKSVHLMLIHLNINIEEAKKQEAALKKVDMTYVDDIQDYFEDLAKKHNDLLHDQNNRKAFARLNTDDQVTQIKKKATDNIVVMADIGGQMIGAIDDKEIKRGVSIIFASRAATSGEAALAIDAANNKAEQIMFDFINRMGYDLDNECQLNFDLEQARWEAIDGPWLEIIMAGCLRSLYVATCQFLMNLNGVTYDSIDNRTYLSFGFQFLGLH